VPRTNKGLYGPFGEPRDMACSALQTAPGDFMFIRFISTGGTIDKIYFDAMSRFEVGESQVKHILTEGLVAFDYDIVSLFQKDSLELTDHDRVELRRYIEDDDGSRYVITHGTDAMTETGTALAGLAGKCIVLTGALSPARFKTTDAVFNVGMAVAAVQTVKPGVYIAMNGQIFSAGEVRKNRAENRFEVLTK
jgi:L-asparaginase